ncbi:MAG: Xaa-Pro peptidase family protein [Bacillota bacterium]
MAAGGDKGTISTGWRRVLELQKSIQSGGLSGALIHKPENIYYFSRVFPIEPSFLIVPYQGEPELVVASSSFKEASRDSLLPVTAGELDITRTVRERLLKRGCLVSEKAAPLKRLWHNIQGQHLGVEFDYFNLNLKKYLQAGSCLDITPIINEMRMIKDSSEISCLKEACRIADAAMAETASLIRAGMTEREVSGLMDRFIKARGADESKARVRAGVNSAKAFTRWMGGEVVEGPLLIDYGARVQGYWSDIARTFYVGKNPDPLFEKIYTLVQDAQLKGFEQMLPGKSIYQVEEAIRRVFAAQGYDQKMIYTAGHGIGLEIHEEPILSMPPQYEEEHPEYPSWSQAAKIYQTMVNQGGKEIGPVFARGQTYALEPGIYIEKFGIRIEDMVLIGDNPELMSSYPRKLEEVTIG